MKGDFSRRTFDQPKHYGAVLQEQGRLLTDADLEEEHRILAGQLETTAADVIGGCGGPLGAAAFALSSPDGTNLVLGAGRYYAAGLALRNETQVSYLNQPDRFAQDIAWPPAPGRYAIVLDVWRRLITALDDPSLREVALGGPTTSVREKTVWQARHLPVAPNWACGDALPVQPTTTGRMAARAEPEAVVATPCLVPPLAGYSGLENQLYRVEVLTAGAALNVANPTLVPITAIPAGPVNAVTVAAAAASALSVGDVVEVVRTGPGSDPFDGTFAQIAGISGQTITLTARLPEFAPTDAPALRRASASVVISRENGSVVTAIQRIDGVKITVADLGPDDILGFAPGQWVELSDDRIELESAPRVLRQIESINADRLVVTLRTPAPALAVNADGVDPARHPKLRRWDAARGVSFRADGSGWVHLENGIQVRFVAGRYTSGDYWQFPARAAIVDAASGNIEWPQQGGAPALLAPAGIEHHLCPVGVVDVVLVATVQPRVRIVDDCRKLFPPVTELTNLLYVGGDGQEATPSGDEFVLLSAPLSVRVANGSHPVPAALVEFRVTAGVGQLNGGAGPAVVTTDANGLAPCTWALDPNNAAQRVEAHLLTHGGSPIAHQLVRFNAILDRDAAGNRSCCVSIGREGDFPTIEEALNVLLDRGHRDICLCLLSGDHPIVDLKLPRIDPAVPFHLSIAGCGRGTRVWVQERFHVDHWASIRLADFDLSFRPAGTFHTVGVGVVTLDGLYITGVPSKVGLIRIHDASVVRVANCSLAARGTGDTAQLRDFFNALSSLETVWDAADERFFSEAIRRAALELDAMNAADRNAFVKELAQRIAQQANFSTGVKARINHLASLIGTKHDPEIVGAAILDVLRAFATQSDTVALEIGAPDERQENLGDPSSVVTAAIVVEGNDIAGSISFYGITTGDALTAAERERLQPLFKAATLVGGHGGTVQLHHNRFNRLLLSVGMIRALRQLAAGGKRLETLFESFLMSHNVIDGAAGQLAALHTALSGNDFTIAALGLPAAPTVVLDVVADTAIFTGNHGATVALATGAQPVIIEQTTRLMSENVNLELRFQ